METIAISKFKATCLAVIERVNRTGEPVLITRRGVPMAELTPTKRKAKHGDWIGSLEGKARILGDIISPAADESDWEVLRD